MANRQVVSARIVIESSSESSERTVGYVVQALKNACKNIRDGTVLITIYDDDEHIIGVDLSGTPSEGLQESFEDFLDKYEDQAQHQVRITPGPSNVRGAHPPASPR